MRCFLPLCFVSLFFVGRLVAQEQLFLFGLKGGVPVTPALPGYGPENPGLDTGRWTVGPSVEFHVIAGLWVEADALFRGYKVTGSFVFVPAGSTSPLYQSFDQGVKAWDFPLLAKYRLPGACLRPFIDVGFQETHESSDYAVSYVYSPEISTGAGSAAYEPPSNYSFKGSLGRRGPVAGAGVEFRYRRFRFDPEVRYTHLTPNINQVTLLAGVGF